MSLIRLIACLLYKDGKLVQSINFKHPVVIGNAITKIQYFNSWQADEIVLLNISKSPTEIDKFHKVIDQLSKVSFVPLSIGGWITTIDQARELLRIGADKIIVNTYAFNNNSFISELVEEFGSQFVTVSIDSKLTDIGYEVFIDRGSQRTHTKVIDWAHKAEALGAGEIFLNSVDHDGSRKGYDLDLMRTVKKSLKIPVIGFGGVWKWSHIKDGILDAELKAVAVGNVLHFIEHSIIRAKKYLTENNINVREPKFFKYGFSRKPNYTDVL